MRYAIDLDSIAILVKRNGTITRLSFRTRQQAGRKLMELIVAGYTFDRSLWSERRQQCARLHIQAHNLCNVLCDDLYNWNPEPERAARLERILIKARARLARREGLE